MVKLEIQKLVSNGIISETEILKKIYRKFQNGNSPDIVLVKKYIKMIKEGYKS